MLQSRPPAGRESGLQLSADLLPTPERSMIPVCLPWCYRGGWTGHQTMRSTEDRPGADCWDRVAIKGDLRIEQGTRTHLEFLDALDRIDGRPVLADLIRGLEAGLSREDAALPVPFGPDGDPLPVPSAPTLVEMAVEPMTTPVMAAPGVPIQQSLFDLMEADA
jgi:hypothetical protein